MQEKNSMLNSKDNGKLKQVKNQEVSPSQSYRIIGQNQRVPSSWSET